MTLNLAHRGFSGRYPENTMLAFTKAIEAGCDGIALEVQLTKDRELVVIHDEKLDRTTDGKGYVCDYTLAELKTLSASGHFQDIYGRTEIPTLKEYFELVADTDIVTNVELKTGVNIYPGIEQKVLRLIQDYKLSERIIISSFNHYSALMFKKLAPQIKCGLLEESWIIGMSGYAKKLGIDYLHPIYYCVTDSYVQEAQAHDLGINTWTVNNREDIQRLKNLNINAIITNYPDLFE